MRCASGSHKQLALTPVVVAAQPAADLQISIHTVRNHVRSLRSKLDAKTKLEAVVTAMRHGLV